MVRDGVKGDGEHLRLFFLDAQICSIPHRSCPLASYVLDTTHNSCLLSSLKLKAEQNAHPRHEFESPSTTTPMLVQNASSILVPQTNLATKPPLLCIKLLRYAQPMF